MVAASLRPTNDDGDDNDPTANTGRQLSHLKGELTSAREDLRTILALNRANAAPRADVHDTCFPRRRQRQQQQNTPQP